MVSGREGVFVQLQQMGFFFFCKIGLWLLLKRLCIFIQSVLQTTVERDLQQPILHHMNSVNLPACICRVYVLYIVPVSVGWCVILTCAY